MRSSVPAANSRQSRRRPDGVDLYDWTPRWPVAVFFGHEVEGLPADVAARCHVHVRIPMHGMKGSLNVATAGGVVLYELLRKHRGGS